MVWVRIINRVEGEERLTDLRKGLGRFNTGGDIQRRAKLVGRGSDRTRDRRNLRSVTDLESVRVSSRTRV